MGWLGVSETWWHIKVFDEYKFNATSTLKSSIDAVITNSILGPLKIGCRGNTSNQNQISNPYSVTKIVRSLVILFENYNSAFR